jgi:hypothetical protein
MTDGELIQLADHIFKDHGAVRTLWQTLADHFYPERADFTFTRNVGTEFADNLVDSYPLLVRRDLGNSLAAMLRDGDWYDMGVGPGQDTSHLDDIWLKKSTRKLRQLMNKRTSNFVRSTKQADHDYITFGQAVITVDLNRERDGLLYQSWHLRDVAWFDDEAGQVGGVCRKWKPTYREVVTLFRENTPKEIQALVTTKPFARAEFRHMVIPAEMLRDDQITEKFKWVSIYLDLTNKAVVEIVGMNYMKYVIPRFQTIAGSPYAYSPATVIGLPDSRCLQAMTHSLLEAGERYARPPIIATSQVVTSAVDLSPDGITWVDEQYDERLGAALRTLPQDRGGFPIGMQMREGILETLKSAFYLNKLTLPDPSSGDMTAYEVSERMKQYRRENLPLFAPIEADYSGALCETSFEVAMAANLLGSVYDIPETLQDTDVNFTFISPLSQSEEEEKVQRFHQVSDMLAKVVELSPGTSANVDFDVAFRDAVKGAGAPPEWLVDMDTVKESRGQQEAMGMLEKANEMGMLEDDVA